ncbi:nuclear transport factor 2 family protein [Mycobacterium sp. KBS0706]|nr:nuclear transport factor 2 family protein [Mycobacterium sp. KBS0706]
MEGFAGAAFTDYLLLMRGSDDHWKIVAKAFTTRS